MIVYSIKDDKSQTWQGAYVFANDALCIREFDAAFKAGKLGLMNQYPGDFSIYKIGDFNEQTGDLKGDLKLVKNFSDFQGSSDGR